MHTIHMIICDDDPVFAQILKEKVGAICEAQEYKYDLSAYTDPNQLLAEIDTNELTLLFLDVDMPEIDGFSLAAKLNKMGNRLYIGFVSGRSEFVYTAFQYRPYFFIPKDKVDIELEKKLISMVEVIGLYRVRVPLLVDGNVKFVYLDEVAYAEVEKNYVIVHTEGTELRIRTSLSELEQNWCEHGFVRVHSGFLVNVHFVLEFGTSGIQMQDGRHIPVSRSKVSDIRQRLMQEIIRIM